MNRRYISMLIGCLIGIAIDQFYYVIIESVSVDHKYKPFGRKLNLDIIGKLPSTSSIEKLAIINDLEKLYTNNGKAKTLAKQVKLLCWVLTMPSALQTKATAIRNTWGKRCNILLFMSSTEDKILPAIRVDGNEGKNGKFFFNQVMNAIFTKHTINNTGNNEIPKSNRTKQELYLTIYFSKKNNVKKQRKISKKTSFNFFSCCFEKAC